VRIYLPATRSDLETLVSTGFITISAGFAVPDKFDIELSEEELDYEASERARDISRGSDQDSHGYVLAAELPRKETVQGENGEITLSRAVSIEEVDSLLLSVPGDDELQWFATQEIDLYLKGQVG
jgi:hypothetical protein